MDLSVKQLKKIEWRAKNREYTQRSRNVEEKAEIVDESATRLAKLGTCKRRDG